MMLPLFGEAKAMEIDLEGEDQTKLKYLTVAIAASKTSSKSIYTTWLRFLTRGMVGSFAMP